MKQVFGVLPASATAGADRFRGSASMGEQSTRWDLAVTAAAGPLRPAVLYRAPLPRTKLEATVPDGVVSGTLEVSGAPVSVSGWRATIGHNWGSEHADSWVWLHAAGFSTAPGGWLELVLARIRIGPARSPWTAVGALSLGRQPVLLGGLGRRPRVDARPGRLTTSIPSPGSRLELSVETAGEDAVAVPYSDPSGGHRLVRHAVRAAVDVTLRRQGEPAVTLTTTGAAYEFSASHGMAGITVQALPEG